MAPPLMPNDDAAAAGAVATAADGGAGAGAGAGAGDGDGDGDGDGEGGGLSEEEEAVARKAGRLKESKAGWLKDRLKERQRGVWTVDPHTSGKPPPKRYRHGATSVRRNQVRVVVGGGDGVVGWVVALGWCVRYSTPTHTPAT